jgi:cell division protein FtsB
MNQLTYSIIEVFISLVVESTILAGVFSYLTNRANEKQEQKLQIELTKIEQQNKLIFQEISKQSSQHRTDIINQIKESVGKENVGPN